MSERNLGALHQPKEETLWYYRSLADGVLRKIANCLFPHALWFESHSQN